MDKLKELTLKFKQYPWTKKLFIFGAPVFAIPDVIYFISDLDRIEITSYVVRCIMCFALVEILSPHFDKK